MADTPKHSVSVAGIVVDDQDRVLVVKRRDNGHWEPPGGVLELDEAPAHGVRREVREETGISVRVVRLTGVYKNMNRGVIALVFKCTVLGGAAAESDETSATRWCSRDEAAALMDDAYAVRLNDAFGESVPVRVHDGRRLMSDAATWSGGEVV